MSVPTGVSPYDFGDLVTLTATVIGSAGPEQPSWFAFFVRNPVGSVATIPMASCRVASQGAFAADVTVDVEGEWQYRAVATGLVQAAERWAFIVEPEWKL